MPEECPHGRRIDWGDFGPEDSWGQGCEACGIRERPRCGHCQGQGIVYRYAGPGKGWRESENPCQTCWGVDSVIGATSPEAIPL